jgi:hypothetical protein
VDPKSVETLGYESRMLAPSRQRCALADKAFRLTHIGPRSGTADDGRHAREEVRQLRMGIGEILEDEDGLRARRVVQPGVVPGTGADGSEPGLSRRAAPLSRGLARPRGCATRAVTKPRESKS